MILQRILVFKIMMALPYGTICQISSTCRYFKDIFKSNENETNIEKCNVQAIVLGQSREVIKKLRASRNLIRSLEDKDLKGATKLLDIDLSYNHINHISCNAFKDQTKLINLKMSYNHLKRLTPGIFDSLIHLERLEARENNLMIIEGQLFTNNTKLAWIDFSFNQIIDISANSLSFIKPNAFIDLTGNICDDSKRENSADSMKKLKSCFGALKNVQKKIDEYNKKYFKNCKTIQHNEYDNGSDPNIEMNMVIHDGTASVFAVIISVLMICGCSVCLVYFIRGKKNKPITSAQYDAVTEASIAITNTPNVHDEEHTYIEMS